MSRLETKCIIGSAALHGLLLVCFVFGSAFLTSRKHVTLPPVVTMLAIPTDRPIASGGNPNANPQPQPKPEPPPPAPRPQPEPPPVVKPEVKPREPEPPPKKTEVVKKTEPVKPPVQKKTDAPKIEKTETKKPLTYTAVRRTNDWTKVQKELADKAAAEKRRQEEWKQYVQKQQKLAGELGKIIGNVSSSLEKNTVAEPVGPGGAAYVNYASLIIERYKAAVYASQPQSDDDAEAIIRVVISRNGTVRSSQWVRRTSNPVLNRAVERAMNTVRSLPEFPPEAKDAERTFNITIAFEARRVSA